MRKGEKAKLLSGGNPQIAKADGDAPVQAYIAAMPGWKRDLGKRLDALIVRNVPNVRKAVKWNSPFYGIEGQGWFLSFHVFTRYVKVTFFRGTSLRPVPPGASKHKDVRYLDIHEGDELDEAQMATLGEAGGRVARLEHVEPAFRASPLASAQPQVDTLPRCAPGCDVAPAGEGGVLRTLAPPASRSTMPSSWQCGAIRPSRASADSCPTTAPCPPTLWRRAVGGRLVRRARFRCHRGTSVRATIASSGLGARLALRPSASTTRRASGEHRFTVAAGRAIQGRLDGSPLQQLGHSVRAQPQIFEPAVCVTVRCALRAGERDQAAAIG